MRTYSPEEIEEEYGKAHPALAECLIDDIIIDADPGLALSIGLIHFLEPSEDRCRRCNVSWASHALQGCAAWT